MKPAVSVIVPVYNVEEYIGECARSLFRQTLSDVEYIFVNDCTNDRSMDVLREVIQDYPSRAVNVIIVEKKRNEGLPAARKTGLDLASGEYVSHCDSDDWMEENMLELMYKEAHSHDADGVVCAWSHGDNPAFTKYTITSANCRDFIFEDMVSAREMQSVWRYMFKRDVYTRGIEFPECNQGEDHALLVQLLYHSDSVYCVDKPLYHWRYSPESLTHSIDRLATLRRFEGACANTRMVEAFLREKILDERLSTQLVALKLKSMLYLRPLLRLGKEVERFRNVFPEIKGMVICDNYITFRHKIEYLVNRYCPRGVIKALYKLSRILTF